MEVIKLNEDQLISLLFNQFLSKFILSIEDISKSISSIKNLPLVLTNEDLKREFQIGDTTLNRLINLAVGMESEVITQKKLFLNGISKLNMKNSEKKCNSYALYKFHFERTIYYNGYVRLL